MFQGLDSLKFLNIRNYSVLLKDVEAEVFKDTPLLTHLDLSHNRLRKDVLKCLLNQTLEMMNVENYEIEISDASLIQHFHLLSQNPKVNLNVSFF